MGKNDSSSPQDKLSRSKKKLNKQKRRLQERLEKARKARKKSEERLQIAQERFQVKAERVQQLEQRLLTIQSRLITVSLLSSADISTGEGSSVFDEEELFMEWDVSSADEQSEATYRYEDSLNERAAHVHEEADALARDARSIAEVAEDAARIAVARAEYADDRLAKESIGRHLAQEYEHLQVEAERAQLLALETAQAAEEAEQLLSSLISEEDVTPVDIELEELSVDATFLDNVAKENDEMFDEIEKDDDAFAAVASLILADAEADETAESVALLEASSEHVVDAHELVKQAEYTLSLVRAAVKEGTLSGDDAVRAFTAAEMEVVHARSLLKNVAGQPEEHHANDNEGDGEQ
ncbi:hypothetical protein [Dictyobacter kobayashii]|uniref:Uncharacterized protein n=1 Tax=Dictyobacter kobayashii TaxID=2014872 RepID=A0A402AG15_9CHLR|nr:hypothetical protein [Dictyobacter kobayashii]GCE18068.1 hypothetical protein KDK_18680 [Dictyobacter kobayashii]